MKKTVNLALAVATAIGAWGYAGSVIATEEGKLLIWMNSDKAYDGLQKVGNQFTKDTGVPVVVEHPDDAPGKFQQGAAAGKGPDVFMWAHDRMGEWAESGLLTPIEPSPEIRDKIISIGWEAFTYNARVWGYPVSVEAVGLIYNKDLLPEPPKTFEEMAELHKKLTAEKQVGAIMWDYNNTYFSWPLLAANGAYVFGGKIGQLDPTDVGVAGDGAVTGATLVKKFIDEGIMPKGTGYSEMDAAFNRSEVAMMINGPWSWANIKASDIKFGIAPIPSVAGKPSRPFVGVQGMMLSRASKNKELAREFLENYVLTPAGLKTMNDDKPLGTPAHKEYFKELSNDEHVKATMANVEVGLPMPNIPAMGKFWAAMGPALENITNGRQPVKEALTAAATRIKGGDEAEEQ
jgi:maltose/maltodextrin transport system substrate-binding protein